VVQVQVNGVAWFEHDDGAGGWNTPILLKSFRRIANDAEQHKAAMAFQAKPLARFETISPLP